MMAEKHFSLEFMLMAENKGDAQAKRDRLLEEIQKNDAALSKGIGFSIPGLSMEMQDHHYGRWGGSVMVYMECEFGEAEKVVMDIEDQLSQCDPELRCTIKVRREP